MKLRVGNKQNSYLNGEWASHVKKDGKKLTSSIRRQEDKRIIRVELEDAEFDIYKTRKKRKKVWIVEEYKIHQSMWNKSFSKYYKKEDAIKSVHSYKNHFINSTDYWRNYFMSKVFRVRNTETGEVVNVPTSLN